MSKISFSEQPAAPVSHQPPMGSGEIQRIQRKKPSVIRCDNGPEFISHEFTQWAKKQGIRIENVQPGNPQQNAYIERANRTIRYSWVSKHLFETLEEVQEYVTKRLWFYNHERPHKANGGRPPLMAA